MGLLQMRSTNGVADDTAEWRQQRELGGKIRLTYILGSLFFDTAVGRVAHPKWSPLEDLATTRCGDAGISNLASPAF